MPKDVNKAASLDKILPVLGVKREETVCCGDGFNDISMIQYAGVGVAMGNAQQVVKEAADYVTAANDEEELLLQVFCLFRFGSHQTLINIKIHKFHKMIHFSEP